jgi:fluoride exporter
VIRTLVGVLLIGAGGMIGALCRYFLGRLISTNIRSIFPWGTWTINLTGSLILGVFASYTHNGQVHELVWKACGVGFLGAYTTFSTFGFETIRLIESGEKKSAAIYVISSVILGILFAWIGYWLGNRLFYIDFVMTNLG